MHLAPGTVVDDRYEILHLIGEGGMGAVYRARELGLERTIALKVLHTCLALNNESLGRFLREGKVLSTLNHPNILRSFRLGVSKEEFPYIAMEFLDGCSLREILDKKGPLPIGRFITLALQISAALSEAEKLEVVHRDLKPSNIMVLSNTGDELVCKVVDFGLARFSGSSGNTSQHLTHTGELVGTLMYMSPEACLGKPQDHRSDIYSVGCLLYEAIVGKPPFDGDNPVQLMNAHTSIHAERLANRLPPKTVPAGLQAFLDRCMAKEAANRYQSFAELTTDLKRIQQGRGQDIASVPIPVSTPAIKRKVVIACIAVSGVALVSVGALMVENANSARKWNSNKGNEVVISGRQLQSVIDRDQQKKDLEVSIGRMVQRLKSSTAVDERIGLADKAFHEMRVLSSLYRDVPAGIVNAEEIDLSEKWERAAIEVADQASASLSRKVGCWTSLARGRMRRALQTDDKVEQAKELLKAKNYLQNAADVCRGNREVVKQEDWLGYLLLTSLFWCQNDDYERGRWSFVEALKTARGPRVSSDFQEGFKTSEDFCDRRVRRFLVDLNTFANPKTKSDGLLACDIMAAGVEYLLKVRMCMNDDQLAKSIQKSFSRAFPKVPTSGEELEQYSKLQHLFDAYRTACAKQQGRSLDDVDE